MRSLYRDDGNLRTASSREMKTCKKGHGDVTCFYLFPGLTEILYISQYLFTFTTSSCHSIIVNLANRSLMKIHNSRLRINA